MPFLLPSRALSLAVIVTGRHDPEQFALAVHPLAEPDVQLQRVADGVEDDAAPITAILLAVYVETHVMNFYIGSVLAKMVINPYAGSTFAALACVVFIFAATQQRSSRLLRIVFIILAILAMLLAAFLLPANITPA